MLSELNDLDDAILRAQDEYHRCLMNRMLGTNKPADKSKRDSRFLQEAPQPERESPPGRGGKSRQKRAVDPLLAIRHAELKEFWNSLPLAERAALCHVPHGKLKDAVLALLAAPKREKEDQAQQDEPELLLQVLVILMQPNALDFMNAEKRAKIEREASRGRASRCSKAAGGRGDWVRRSLRGSSKLAADSRSRTCCATSSSSPTRRR